MLDWSCRRSQTKRMQAHEGASNLNNNMKSTTKAMAPSPAQPLSGKGVRRISPSLTTDSTTESTGSVSGSIGPVHDTTHHTEAVKPKVSQSSTAMIVPKPSTSVQGVDKYIRQSDKPKSKRFERNTKENTQRQEMEIFSGINAYDRFYIVAAADSTPLSTINTIKAYEDLKKHIGGIPKKIIERRDGGLSISVNNKEQSDRLQTLTELAGIEVVVRSDTNLNRCQGTIRYENYPGFTTQQILEALKPFQVTDVYQLTRKNENKTATPIPIYILTFGTTKLPNNVTIGWTNCSVRIFIPRPRRCFKCQRFGHSSTSCRSQADICGKCGQMAHEEECSNPVCCINCNGPHPAFVRACPAYNKEQEILAYKVRNNVSYYEAKTEVNKNYGTSQTYSQALLNQTSHQHNQASTMYYQSPRAPVTSNNLPTGRRDATDCNSQFSCKNLPENSHDQIHKKTKSPKKSDNNNNNISKTKQDSQPGSPNSKQTRPPDNDFTKNNPTKENQNISKRARENSSSPNVNPAKKAQSIKEKTYPIKVIAPKELPKSKSGK